MLVLDEGRIRSLVRMPRLIDALQQAFLTESTIPPRQVLAVPGGQGDRLFAAMPAFDREGGAAIKLATAFPDNADRGLPTIQAAIVVFSRTGMPVALLDGALITQLRTGAASALASRYLSREDSSHLLVAGTGALAPAMAVAHCAVRPITRISVWGRRPERASATVATIRAQINPDIQVSLAPSLEDGVATADIVTCATSSATPILLGKWLRSGTFIDLVGSFSASKREADDEVMLRSRVFVDTFAGALEEGGDVVDPLARGVIDRSRIEGELADLTCGRAVGRGDRQEIIVFKSVGSALEDLAAAQLAVAAAVEAGRPMQ